MELFAKGLFLIALLGLVIGFSLAYRDGDGIESSTCFGLLMFFLSPVPFAFIGAIGYGIFWLFN